MEPNDSEILIQLKAKLIAPLLQIDGIVCVTTLRVYFQPLHAGTFDDNVLKLEIKNLIQLFKRRYTLQDLGLEMVEQLPLLSANDVDNMDLNEDKFVPK